VSELVATLRDAIAALAASDRSLKRFGARVHRYELKPPLANADRAWPDDVRELATTFASGGAGPYYGFQLGPRSTRGLIVGHMGCGYAATLIDGAVYVDAPSIGVLAPIAPSFTAYYLDWIDRLAHNVLPEAFVPPGVCPLPAALGGFLAVHEARLGIAPGTIGGDELKEALAELGAGSIEIAASASPLFPDGTRVDPCIACAKLLANLGLSEAIVRPAD
jgi:hypothetical protein